MIDTLDVMAFAGIGCLWYGLGQYSPPLGWIGAGVALLALFVYLTRRRR